MRKNSIKLALAAMLTLGTGAWFFTENLQPGSFTVNRTTVQDGEETQTIKGAMAYLHSLKADLQTNKVDVNAVYNVYAQLDRTSRSKMGDWLQWDEMGPDDVGGRTRGIVVDKDNNRIIYAGGVSGGLWKSINAGTTWQRIGGRDLENINVSSLAQTVDGALYYGTGEGGFTYGNADGNSGFLGRGIFKSTDGGKSFQQLKSTNPTNNTSPWHNVHRLVADPTNANRLYAGNDGGLFVTDDAGATWKKVTMPTNYNKGKYILTNPDGQIVYVAMANSNPGTAYQLFRSKDRGQTFERIGNGTGTKLPNNSSSFVMAMSPQDQNVIYLSSAATNGTLDAVYRSEDGGDSWILIGKGDSHFNPLASQGSYNHCIVVDPKNQNRIVIGGLNLWEGKGINGRFQWTQLTNWSFERMGDGSTNPYYVHADQHILLFDNSEKPVLYIGHDGGVSKSVDFTYNTKPTFMNADYGYNTVQFYGIGVSAYNPDEVIGGTQDNGVLTVMKTGGGLTGLNSDKIRGGDGGFSEISMINPNVYFGEYVHGAIYRSFTKGANWSTFFDNNVPVEGPARYPFISIFSLWESLNDPTSIDSVLFVDDDTDYKAGDRVTVKNASGYTYNITLPRNIAAGEPYKFQDVVQSKFYIGAYNGIYFTRQALVSGITPTFFKLADIPGFTPHDIKHSKDGNTVFVSGANGVTGEVYRITGLSGKKFQYIDEKFNPADYGIVTTRIFTKNGQIATGIAIDENDPNHVIVTLGSYGYTDHVYRTKDAMNTSGMPTFQNISSNLPDFPVYDALISMSNPNDYLIAGEYGVWSSRNGGTSWKEENEGMERVPTFMLRQMKFGNQPWAKPVFYAATHGRGVFRTKTLVGMDDKEMGSKNPVSELSLYPNPAQDVANLTFELTKAGDVQIVIIDIQGRTVGQYSYSRQMAGKHTYRLETANLNKGTYFVKVSSNGLNKTSKLLIMK